jgi:hypothetical protein
MGQNCVAWVHKGKRSKRETTASSLVALKPIKKNPYIHYSASLA